MSGFHEDTVPGGALTSLLKDDHVMIGRSGNVYRVEKRIIANMAPLVPAIARPQLTDFGAWVNQVNAIGTDEDYGFSIFCPARGATDSLNMRERSTPASAQYAVTLGVALNSMFRGNLAGGIALRESSSGKLELFGLGKPNNSGMAFERWGSATGGRVTRDSTTDNTRVAFLRFAVGGNHYQPLISYDGVHYMPFSEPILMLDTFTAGPNKWGLWANNNSTPSLDISVLAFHYEEVSGVNNLTTFPAYVNKGGSGSRAAQITVTTDATVTLASIQTLVDGDYLGGVAKAKFAADATGNRQITFQFSAAVRITEATFLMNSASSQGTWKWQGSNNGSSWTDLNGGATFTLTGTSSGTVLGDLSTNQVAYSYYRMQQTAGSLTTTPTLRQIHFKILN
jgi:hypothetical protein